MVAKNLLFIFASAGNSTIVRILAASKFSAILGMEQSVTCNQDLGIIPY
jgi:hypothetical protein